MERDDNDWPPHQKPHKDGNIGPDGEYLVGKNRPPKHSQFASGDGRKRGRRSKGQKNFDTEFAEEARRKITVRENGKERRVSKLRSTIVRAFDNAGSKGQNQAINIIFNHSARIAERGDVAIKGLTAVEDELINAWIAQRLGPGEDGDAPGDGEGAPPEALSASQDRDDG